MDSNQLMSLLQGVFTGPNGFLYAIAIVFGLQWAKTKWPNLFKWVPHFGPTPSPATPVTPATPDAPSTPSPTGRPLLDTLLSLIGPRAAEQVLAGEVQRMVQVPPPEPAAAVVAGRPGRVSLRLAMAMCLAFAAAFGLGRVAIAVASPTKTWRPADTSWRSHSDTSTTAPVDASPLQQVDAWLLVVDAEALDIPIANRIVYALARDKAAEIYAKDKKVSEATARAKLAKVSDATLHKSFKESKLAHPVGDNLADVLRWLVNNKELIFEIAKLLIMLAALL